MKVIQTIDRTLSFIDRILKYIAGFLMLFLVFSISYGVLMRYFFNDPVAWTVEVNEYLMVYVTFLTIAWTLQQNGHVTVEILINKMQHKVKKAVHILTYLVTMVVFLIVFWFSFVAVLDLYERNVVALKILEVPRYITFLPICIGSLLFALRSFINIFDDVILLETDSEREEMS